MLQYDANTRILLLDSDKGEVITIIVSIPTFTHFNIIIILILQVLIDINQLSCNLYKITLKITLEEG